MRSLKEINESQILEYLDAADKNYRPYDPGRYLYVKFCQRNDFLSDEYIELLYIVLVAWGMNSRGAKLDEFDNFRTSILANKDRIQNLREQDLRLESIELDSKQEQFKKLFTSMKLMEEDRTSRFVTYSKTLHLLFPNLCVPMDRKYTLSFYPNNVPKALDKQFEKYWKIMKDMQSFAKEHAEALRQAVDNKENQKWNQNLPKVIDNILIGMNISIRLKRGASEQGNFY